MRLMREICKSRNFANVENILQKYYFHLKRFNSFQLFFQESLALYKRNSKQIKYIMIEGTIQNNNKLIAVIMAEGKYSEMYPLTYSFSVGNLPIGNKKLITYQLEQLQAVQSLSAIFVVYNEENSKIRTYIEGQFRNKYPKYRHHILFHQVENAQPEYISLQSLLHSETAFPYINNNYFQGAIILPLDTISAIKLPEILKVHTQNPSDLTLLLKQKKEYGQGEKKPDVEYEIDIDLCLIGEGNELMSLMSLEEYDFQGYKLPPSIYKQIGRGSFKKVIDSQIYIMGSMLIQLIKNFKHPELIKIKTDLISTVLKNQTNINLISMTEQKEPRPVRIFAKVANPDEYIRRVTQLKIYEQVNFDSLIRGTKQKDILLPTEYSEPNDQKYCSEWKGTIIAQGCSIDSTVRIRRSCVGSGCTIEKGTEIFNTIILPNATIKQGSKINDSVVGEGCIIGHGCHIQFCHIASSVIVQPASKIQNDSILPRD